MHQKVCHERHSYRPGPPSGEKPPAHGTMDRWEVQAQLCYQSIDCTSYRRFLLAEFAVDCQHTPVPRDWYRRMCLSLSCGTICSYLGLVVLPWTELNSLRSVRSYSWHHDSLSGIGLDKIRGTAFILPPLRIFSLKPVSETECRRWRAERVLKWLLHS